MYRKTVSKLCLGLVACFGVVLIPPPAKAEYCPYVKGRQWPYDWVEQRLFSDSIELKKRKACVVQGQGDSVAIYSPLGKGKGYWTGKGDAEGYVMYKRPFSPIFSSGKKFELECISDKPVLGERGICGKRYVARDYYLAKEIDRKVLEIKVRELLLKQLLELTR